jgi:hypothetical protein
MVRKLAKKSGRPDKKTEALRSRLYLEKLEDRVVPAGTWTALNSVAPQAIGTMMMLSDGTVMAQGAGQTNAWYKLTPNAAGSYAAGTWSTRASMSVTRLYFGSNILPDGRVFVIGGEYSSDGGFSRTGEIYNPVMNSWSNIANFPQSSFGDDPTEVLNANGDILGGYVSGPQTYIYHPSTNTWTQTGTKLRNDQSDEESWVKLPDDSILSYDVFSSISSGVGHAQRYVPSTGTWVDAGNVPGPLLTSPGVGYELGPNFLLPDGRVFQLGANNHTAFYTPSTNTWVAGPDMPAGMGADDAPGAVLPTNGHILFTADHPLFGTPTRMFDFDPGTNTFTDITTTLPTALQSVLQANPSYPGRMLVLPNGQILFAPNSFSANQLYVYTPDGSANAAWKPTITAVTDNGDGTFTLSGKQLNGISEGANYGDDAEMSSNYPLVRLVDSTGHVFYARTFNWDNTGVATGSTVETVKFVAPTGVDVNTATITVVANGIASDGFVLTLGVTDVTPTSAALSLDKVRVTFNRAVQVSSFTPDQAVLKDTSGATIPVTVDVVAGSGDTQFDLSFATQTTPGNYSLTIGPNILDTTGKPMDNAYNTTLSIVGPMIIADSGITHGQSYLPGALDTVTEQVTFNEPIDPTTFTPDQVVFYGNNNVFQANNVTAADNTNTKFNITFNADATDQYTMAVGPNIMDTFGNTAALYTAVSFNVLGPKIDATTAMGITPGASYQPGALDTVTEQVTFNEAMDPNSFTPDKVVITGAISGYSYNALSVTPADNTNTKFNIKFAADYTDKWTMAIGPNIYDGFGNAMDQNGNFITGEVQGDQFTVPFNVLGPKVTASTLMGDFTNDIISAVRVTFSEAMDPSTFTSTSGQVKFTGPGNVTIPVTGINPVAGTNNTQFDVSFAPQGKIGNYTMAIGPNIFDTFTNAMDQNGNFLTGEVPGDQYTTPFTVVGPRVLSTQPLPGNTGEPVNALRVTFSKPIDVTTFTPAKIASFGGPGGPIGVTGIFAVPNTNFTQFDITFQPQTTTGSTQSLRVDDGTSEESFNNSAGSETEDNWVANSFQAGAAGDTITSVSFQIGQATYTNRAITVLLYTGSSLTNPHAGSGLTLISQTDTTFSGTNGNLVTIPLATPVTLPPNQVYWAALLLRGVPSNQFPFANDKDAPAGRSWFDVGPTQGGSYNVNNTSRATVLGGTHPVVGAGVQSAGNLILRVNTVGTAYHMVLGPDIRDLYGNQMDQNQNLVSGEIPADQYLATFNIQGLRITTNPAGGHVIPGTNHVRLTFNEPVNPLTFTTGLVTLTGPAGAVPVTSVTAVPFTDDTQFDVNFAPQTTTAPYTLVVSPGMQDFYGNKLDQNGNGIPGEVPGDNYTYNFGISGLRVLSSSPSGAGVGPIDHVRLTFNEAVDPTTFDTTSVDSFTGPSGAIAVTGVTAVDSTNTVFDVTFAPQSAAGAYTMAIGPNIQDTFGNKMDQNDNLIAGEVPGDEYTAKFSISLLTNPGFETGDFTGWSTTGSAQIKTSAFGTGPTEGQYDALVTNDSGPESGSIETFLGLSAGSLATLVSNVTNGSAIKQTVTVSAGMKLTFDWNFLTTEAVGETFYRDFGFVSITPVGSGGTLVKLADTTSSLVTAPASTGFFDMTGFKTFSFTFTTAGTYVIGVGAMNAGDETTNSALLVDNFQLPSTAGSPAGPSVVGGGGDSGGDDDSGGGSSLAAAGSGNQGGGAAPGAARRPHGGHGLSSAAGIGLGTTNGGGSAPAVNTGGGSATSGNDDGAWLVSTLGGQQTLVAPGPTGSATWSATASLGATPPFAGAAPGAQTGSAFANVAAGGYGGGGLGALDAAFADAMDSGTVFDTLA